MTDRTSSGASRSSLRLLPTHRTGFEMSTRPVSPYRDFSSTPAPGSPRPLRVARIARSFGGRHGLESVVEAGPSAVEGVVSGLRLSAVEGVVAGLLLSAVEGVSEGPSAPSPTSATTHARDVTTHEVGQPVG
jgi:hypothetical protein